MRYRNTHPSADLDFTIAGFPLRAPVHGSVEIPDRYAYAVESMGLPLVPYELEPPSPPPAATQEPTPEDPADRSEPTQAAQVSRKERRAAERAAKQAGLPPQG